MVGRAARWTVPSYNAPTDAYENLVQAGVIDSTKVMVFSPEGSQREY